MEKLCGGHLLVGKEASQWHQNESTDIIDRSDQGQFVFVVFAHNVELKFGNKLKNVLRIIL